MQIDADVLQSLFDGLPDVVFFIKDDNGRYTHANLTLVRRLRLERREDAIGRSASELFPPQWGHSYAAQDLSVLGGRVIDDQLEMHLFPNRAPGWCLTSKRPLHLDGRIRGLIGLSRDLAQPDGRQPGYARLRGVLDYLEAHYGETVRMQSLADQAGLSLSQLERQFSRVFQLSPQQWLTRLRIEEAIQRLRGNDTIAAIGLACGFSDQSAFSRQFKATVGVSPSDYRRLNPPPIPVSK